MVAQSSVNKMYLNYLEMSLECKQSDLYIVQRSTFTPRTVRFTLNASILIRVFISLSGYWYRNKRFNVLTFTKNKIDEHRFYTSVTTAIGEN